MFGSDVRIFFGEVVRNHQRFCLFVGEAGKKAVYSRKFRSTGDLRRFKILFVRLSVGLKS